MERRTPSSRASALANLLREFGIHAGYDAARTKLAEKLLENPPNGDDLAELWHEAAVVLEAANPAGLLASRLSAGTWQAWIADIRVRNAALDRRKLPRPGTRAKTPSPREHDAGETLMAENTRRQRENDRKWREQNQAESS